MRSLFISLSLSVLFTCTALAEIAVIGPTATMAKYKPQSGETVFTVGDDESWTPTKYFNWASRQREKGLPFLVKISTAELADLVERTRKPNTLGALVLGLMEAGYFISGKGESQFTLTLGANFRFEAFTSVKHHFQRDFDAQTFGRFWNRKLKRTSSLKNKARLKNHLARTVDE